MEVVYVMPIQVMTTVKSAMTIVTVVIATIVPTTEMENVFFLQRLVMSQATCRFAALINLSSMRGLSTKDLSLGVVW